MQGLLLGGLVHITCKHTSWLLSFVQALLDKASPGLAKVLNGEIANSIIGLKKLPGVMGFQETGVRRSQHRLR